MRLSNTGRTSVGVGGYSRVYQTRFNEFLAGPGILQARHAQGIARFRRRTGLRRYRRRPLPAAGRPRIRAGGKADPLLPPARLRLYLARLHLGEREAARSDLAKAFARDDKSRARGQVCQAKTMVGEHAGGLGDIEKAKSIMFHRPECGPPAPADKAS